MDVDVLALSLQNVHVGTEFTLPTTVTALTLVKVSNLTQIAIPEATQRLMLKGVEMSKLVVPHNVGFLSLKNLKLTALEIPEKCTELRIGGMPLQSVSYPSGITRLKAKKKILKLFNAEHLPLVPKEIFEERN
ncbi:hypothetical protein EIN_059090 [Entamoeba invadens IP1]|uniref:hypothetical protein n=1 Tax=Entamoeba invadens IP1 TaxID=370355 RepID=UPI0002C3D99B|nr:hypothetical protein EIN_059090 [Entamoeba invadens IP1]ELP93444.1 hypothetical protein EIN_059090 [Entamoeba invadens IP1]|eukprot:XP_004260215.1 hypothetical protein EIN_059090 [Entamoeba invadens IP1]